MKLRILESNYLIEDIAAVKKYYPNIPDDMFMYLISLDPTYRDGSNSLGNYGKWILNLYNKGKLSDDDYSEVPALLTQFNTYKNRIQNKDLNAYKSVADLYDAVSAVVNDDSMLSDRQKVRFNKNVKAGRVKVAAEDDYDTPFEDSEFVVYIPNTHEASMKLGKGTSWCTAHENDDYYTKYTDGNKLYIVVNKKTGDKWQFSDQTYEFRDSRDDEYSPSDFREEIASDDLIDYLDSVGFDNAKEPGSDEDDEVEYEVNVDGGTLTLLSLYDGDEIDLSYASMYDPVDTLELPEDIDRCTSDSLSGIDGVDTLIVGGQCYEFGERVCAESSFREVYADSVSAVGDSTFKGCSNLETVSMQDLQYIPSETFSGCTSLKSIRIDSVRHIGTKAFYQCEELETLPMLYGVFSIDEDAFVGCLSLSSVTIHGRGLKLQKDTFRVCSVLKELWLLGTVVSADPDFISGSRNDVDIYVSEGAKDAIIDAVKQMTRRGAVTVMDSDTGEILYRYEEQEDW